MDPSPYPPLYGREYDVLPMWPRCRLYCSPSLTGRDGVGLYMQLAVPNVVAMAVRIVITMLRILPQVLLLLNVPIVK